MARAGSFAALPPAQPERAARCESTSTGRTSLNFPSCGSYGMDVRGARPVCENTLFSRLSRRVRFFQPSAVLTRLMSTMPMSRAREEAAAATALVDRAKAGEPAAFDALVRRYRKRIFALALHLSGSESDADDITQDVWISAYHTPERFEG